MGSKFDLRSRDSIKSAPLAGAPRRTNTSKLDTEPTCQETLARLRRRGTARPVPPPAGWKLEQNEEPPPPGWRPEQDEEFSDDEEPELEPTLSKHAMDNDGPGLSRNLSGRRTPPPSPRRTPEPALGARRPPQATAVSPLKVEQATSPSTVRLVALLAVLLVAACVYYRYSGEADPPRVSFGDQSLMKEGVQRWRDEVTALAGRFPYQRQRLWKVLRASVSRMLLQARQPAVVLLLASEAQRDDVRCVLRAAAAAVLNATQSPGRPLEVDGAVLGALDEQEAKGRLKTELDQLRGGDGVAVFMVEELQQLQPLTAMLLHGFCDNDNAPRKNALFLLSVVVGRTPPGDTDLDRAVEHALWQTWGRALSEEIFDALLGRIAGNVAAVADEGSELLCHKIGL